MCGVVLNCCFECCWVGVCLCCCLSGCFVDVALIVSALDFNLGCRFVIFVFGVGGLLLLVVSAVGWFVVIVFWLLFVGRLVRDGCACGLFWL